MLASWGRSLANTTTRVSGSPLSGQTTLPWRGRSEVLYQPSCEAYAPWPSGAVPSCTEVAEHAMQLFDMDALELLQVGARSCRGLEGAGAWGLPSSAQLASNVCATP
jgi:hypothetical protein